MLTSYTKFSPPHERRNFVHKRIIGAVGGFLGGGPAGAVGGFIGGGGGSGRSGGAPRSANVPIAGLNLAPSRTGCRPGSTEVDGICRSNTGSFRGRIERLLPFGQTGTVPAGGAIMGQFGAALEPFVEDRHVRTCLPGMVLGKDGNCYNRRDISNKQRAYPRGTRPLGTPGEMAALRKAASFGRRMETTVKRMQKIGVLKKPSRGRRSPATRHLTGPSHS